MKLFAFLKNKIREYSASHGCTCDGCGREIFDYPDRRLCERCETAMQRNDKGTCEKCGRQTLAEGVCLTCKTRPPRFTRGFSPFVYRGETAGLINRVKNGEPTLALYFGENMAEYFTAVCAEAQTPFLVIPVPLTKARVRERGYNQAEELAAALCRALKGKGVEAELRPDILQKRRETGQQKHMGYVARMENAAGAYHVHERKACRGRTVLLVDDILTTGATGNECAERLLSAGAEKVYFLTATALPERK